jgi:tetrapyrrole methylase family protein/MazG family protein
VAFFEGVSVMSVEFPVKDRYTMEDLLGLMVALRSPEGCPWDREQTHESIRSNFLEETHEAIEAINNRDVAGLREELGDVLMQVTLHTVLLMRHWCTRLLPIWG